MGVWGRILVLSLGGALGVNARYWLAVWIDARLGKSYPWATFLINVSGAFALGFLATVWGRFDAHHPLRLLALVGFLGGYTTFSTFALESCTLWFGRQTGRSLIYMFSSVAGGFLAVMLGIILGRACMGEPATPRPGNPGGSQLAPMEDVGGQAEIA